MNVGGPAIQTVNLTHRLQSLGYETVLLRGTEGMHEGSMDYLAEALGVRPVLVPGLRRSLGLHDLRALWEIMRWMRRWRPAVLHTHTAKAGALGRLAALLSPGARPRVIVHTFHGHVFEGEFSPRLSRFFAGLERLLARGATRIVAVSDEVRAELVELRVAPPEKIEVVRLGFDLAPFVLVEDERRQVRASTRERLGIPADARVVTLVARVVKVKRVDRFIAMAELLAASRPDVWFLIAGDGDQRAELQRSEAAVALRARLVWTGFDRDIAAIAAASDLVALTSDNEGTPVCLIEAQAASRPVVATRVGGVATVVLDGQSGRVVEKDADALAAAVGELIDDPERSAAFGERGRAHALSSFSIERLVSDIHDLYSRLLAETGDAAGGEGRS